MKALHLDPIEPTDDLQFIRRCDLQVRTLRPEQRPPAAQPLDQEHPLGADQALPLRADQVESLHQALCAVPDPRAPNRVFSCASLWTLVALARWLDGNRDELTPIRIPTEAEQRRRETTRRRQFLVCQRRPLANRGHGQAAEYAHLKLPPRWWGARHWPQIAPLDPWLPGVLEKLRELILAIEAQLTALETELKARVAEQPRPKGLGEISLATLDSEVCDRGRFHNRKQIGSYTGCCPGDKAEP